MVINLIPKLTTAILSHILIYKGFFNAKYPFGAKLTKKHTGSISIDDQLNYDNILKILNNLIGIPYKWGEDIIGF